MLPPELRTGVTNLEIEALSVHSSIQVLHHYNTLQQRFKRAKLDLTHYVSAEVLHIITISTIVHGPAKNVVRALHDSQWKLSILDLTKYFGDETLLSERFLRKLNEIAQATDIAWPRFWQEACAVRDERTNPATENKNGVALSHDWRPFDLQTAAERLNIQLKKRRNHAQASCPFFGE
ncbi:hypothetical protein BKA81DRAFT_198865 [Phyllosticta paracitricarpa]